MKVVYGFVLFLIFSFSAVASSDRAKYLECNNCYTVSDLAKSAETDFHNKHIADVNQNYYYTIVNESAQIAAFVNIQRRYFDKEPGVPPIDVVQVKILTVDDDLYNDYLLSKYVLRGQQYAPRSFGFAIFNDEGPKIMSIQIDKSISGATTVGLGVYRGEISSALKSNVNSSDWAKLAGRSVIEVNFNDGYLLAFFVDAFISEMYVYLDGTAFYSSGEAVGIPSGVSNSGGGDGGSGGSGGGGGTWSPPGSGGGGIVCTGIHGDQTCTWQYY